LQAVLGEMPVLAAEQSAWVSILLILLPAVIAGIGSALALILTRKYKIQDKGAEDKGLIYKTDAEQVAKQREFLLVENQTLYSLLKEELENCRKERLELDIVIARLNSTIDGLTKRLSKVEAELESWEIGLRTPKGFVLLKVEESQNDPKDK